MPTRRAHARWEGGKSGKGRVEFGDGAFSGPYSFASRFEEEKGTNPEALLGAAHAGCFSMALGLALEAAGHPARSVKTTAHVTVVPKDGGFQITRSHLATEVTAQGLEELAFRELVEAAKSGCPVSKALTGVEITLDAKLVPG